MNIYNSVYFKIDYLIIMVLQARYLSCMSKYKNSMAVLETVKLYMERVIFRLIFNLSPIAMPLTAMTSKTYASKAVEIIYTPFCVNPGNFSE